MTGDAPRPVPWFARRLVVVVNGAASQVGLMLGELPPDTVVWGAHTTTSNFRVPTCELELEVALVHPNLGPVPELEQAPRVTLEEFIQAVTR